MIDRYLEALEQYEMEIISVRKGRGAWICETDQGLKLLREYRGTVRRLEIRRPDSGNDRYPYKPADRPVREKPGRRAIDYGGRRNTLHIKGVVFRPGM